MSRSYSRRSLVFRPLFRPALVTLCLVGALVLEPADNRPAMAAVGPSQTLSDVSPFSACSAPGDKVFPNSEAGPSVAVNPTTVGTGQVNLIGVWEVDLWSDINSRGIVAGYSFDGGKTWARSVLPFGQCSGSPITAKYDRVSQADVSFGPDGTAYAVAWATEPASNAILAATSRDGGRTWANTAVVTAEPGDAYSNFLPRVTADPTRPGTAYLVSDLNQLTADGPMDITLARTTDGGVTWSKPQRLTSAPKWNGFTSDRMVVDPRDGTLYIAYDFSKARTVAKKTCKTLKGKKGKTGKKKACTTRRVVPSNPQYDDLLGFIKSTDAGRTWSAPTTIRTLVQPDNPRPSSAVDPAGGKLYITWLDHTLAASSNATVGITRSADGGATWSSPARVTPDSVGQVSSPTVTVNAAGVVGVTYYAQSQAPGSLMATYRFASSVDGGGHFSDQQIAGPFDLGMTPVTKTRQGHQVGIHQGLAVAGPVFDALFVRGNDGNTTNPTDIDLVSVTL